MENIASLWIIRLSISTKIMKNYERKSTRTLVQYRIMKKKDIYSAMTQSLTQTLETITCEVLSVEQGEKHLEDEAGNSTGEVEHFLRFETEIPRGNGFLSKVRFTTKISGSKLKFHSEDIDDGVSIQFQGLEVSFIDSRRNVYFKATDYLVKEEI